MGISTNTKLFTASDDNFAMWVAGLGCASIGFLVNVFLVRKMGKRRQKLYIKQEYGRSIYYDQYISRVNLILKSLYIDLNRIHDNIFGNEYPVNDDFGNDVVSDLLNGVKATFCKYVHKHMDEKKITPELWLLCEADSKNAEEKCKFWED